MSTGTDADIHEFHGWTFRFRPATATPSRLLVMLHGWTGDENSMWIFARNIPAKLAVISPRGPFVATQGGYTWHTNRVGSGRLPGMKDFKVSADALVEFIDDWSPVSGIKASQIDLIGFSQGAAFSYALAFFHPGRVRALAALSGFIPAGAERSMAKGFLAGKKVFVAHGRQDETVPVELARSSVALLENSGARVTYCESDGGHKVNKDCITGIKEFLE